jgi:CheY-like chemotaxis protein
MPQAYTILVVDDEEVLRDLLQRICTAKGHEVIQASSGKEAIALLKSQTDDRRPTTHDRRVDIAFVDIMMPQMDGISTFKALKEIQPNLPIVMMTGFAVDEKIQEAMKLGAIDYLYKPFDIVEVVTMFQTIEKRKSLKPAVRIQD